MLGIRHGHPLYLINTNIKATKCSYKKWIETEDKWNRSSRTDFLFLSFSMWKRRGNNCHFPISSNIKLSFSKFLFLINTLSCKIGHQNRLHFSVKMKNAQNDFRSFEAIVEIVGYIMCKKRRLIRSLIKTLILLISRLNPSFLLFNSKHSHH